MGRPPKALPDSFYDVYQKWTMGKITGVEAAKHRGIPEPTFRYKAKAYKDSTQSDER